MKKRVKRNIKTSTIFFCISLFLLFVLIAPYIQEQAMLGGELGVSSEGIKAGFTISDISERSAVLLSLTIISTLIGLYLKKKGK